MVFKAQWTLIFLTVCLLSGLSPANSLTAESPEHDAIRHVRDEMLEAIKKNDVDALLKHVSNRAVFTAMNGETVRGHDGIRGYFKRMMEGPDSIVKSITLEMTVDDLTTLFGGDTGIATGSSKDSYELRDGTNFIASTRWTAVLIKERGEWMLAAFQSSLNPFDNPVLHQTEKMALIGGGVGIILSLLLGGAIGFGLGRRRRG